MKRAALLIGNTGGLAGVSLDIRKMQSFLGSSKGGDWYDSEIVSLINPTRAEAIATVEQIRKDRPDYFLFLFTGHGSYYRQTHLNLNEKEEKLLESELSSVAPRQLSIFDCCRVLSGTRIGAEALHEVYDSAESSRYRYDARIMSAAPQHSRLYACAEGQVSYDYPDGALYLGNLLKAANSIGVDPWMTVEDAHAKAREATIKRSREDDEEQTPQAILPKLLRSQQLILSIK